MEKLLLSPHRWAEKALGKLTVSDVDQLLAWKRNAATAPTRSASFELYFAAL